MVTEIRALLETIEQKNGVEILYACESGSWAWGFPSPDSIYNVKFIYKHSLEWYLTVNEQTDQLEIPVHEQIELEGWDIRNALFLLKMSNSKLLEWVRSPVIYKNNHAFLADLFSLCVDSYSPAATLNQYLMHAQTHHSRLKEKEERTLADYFNAIRPSLASLWISQTKGLPPVEIQRLLGAIKPDVLQHKLMALIDLKRTNREDTPHPVDIELDALIESSIAQSEAMTNKLPVSNIDFARLNAFFRKVLKGAYEFKKD